MGNESTNIKLLVKLTVWENVSECIEQFGWLGWNKVESAGMVGEREREGEGC